MFGHHAFYFITTLPCPAVRENDLPVALTIPLDFKAFNIYIHSTENAIMVGHLLIRTQEFSIFRWTRTGHNHPLFIPITTRSAVMMHRSRHPKSWHAITSLSVEKDRNVSAAIHD